LNFNNSKTCEEAGKKSVWKDEGFFKTIFKHDTNIRIIRLVIENICD
jgi:hypothetical protein